LNDSDARLQEAWKYLRDRGLDSSFTLIFRETGLLRARIERLKETIEALRTLFLRGEFPTSMAEEAVTNAQVLQLEIVSGLFMILEDYLTFSHVLRINIKELPRLIVHQRTMGVMKDEIDYLRGLTLSDMGNYLLYPYFKTLGLSAKEQRFLKFHLVDLSKKSLAIIKRLVIFYDRYGRIYARYKHAFTALVGLPGGHFDAASGRTSLSSIIYVRDITVDKQSKKDKIVTYLLPTDLVALNYYEDILQDLKVIFSNILSAQLNTLLNKGSRALFPTGDHDNEQDKQEWARIANKVNFLAIPFYRLQISLNVKLTKQQRKRLQRNGILDWKHDILQGGIKAFLYEHEMK